MHDVLFVLRSRQFARPLAFRASASERGGPIWWPHVCNAAPLRRIDWQTLFQQLGGRPTKAATPRMGFRAFRRRDLCYRLAGDDTGHLPWAAFRELRSDWPCLASSAGPVVFLFSVTNRLALHSATPSQNLAGPCIETFVHAHSRWAYQMATLLRLPWLTQGGHQQTPKPDTI